MGIWSRGYTGQGGSPIFSFDVGRAKPGNGRHSEQIESKGNQRRPSQPLTHTHFFRVCFGKPVFPWQKPIPFLVEGRPHTLKKGRVFGAFGVRGSTRWFFTQCVASFSLPFRSTKRCRETHSKQKSDSSHPFVGINLETSGIGLQVKLCNATFSLVDVGLGEPKFEKFSS